MADAAGVADAAGWDLIIPVKRLESAKSRLEGLVSQRRQDLALAFACDAVDAAASASRVERVFVVTEDPRARVTLFLRGAILVGETHGRGLNRAIEAGIAAVQRQSVVEGQGPAQSLITARRLAVMTGDLPAVTSREIDAALAAAELLPRAILADAEGTGTVLLTANPHAATKAGANPHVVNPHAAPEAAVTLPLHPQFGQGSLLRHVEAGHVPLCGEYPGLRRDVDTQEDLADARRLGVGPATQATLNALVNA